MARRTRKMEPKDHIPEFLTQGKDQEGLEERFINDFIGRGVFTAKFFSKGDFLLEYRGELITGDEGSEREDFYNPDLGSFLFFFKDGSQYLCVDATFASGLGRLVNDASPTKPNCNCVMRKIKAEKKTYLALYALRDIAIGEELRYDYGVKDLPWRNLKVNQKTDDNVQNCATNACRDEEEVSADSEGFAFTDDDCICRAVARKRPYDCRSDKEYEDPHATTKKTSWKRSKAVRFERDSKREQNGDANGNETKEDDEVVISCSKKSENNARIYDKRHSCFYCDKLFAKIARHYEQCHGGEAEVAEAFTYPRGSPDRRKALEKLRLRGNFHHNLHALECKSGQLIVMRRPGEDENCSQDDYLPCVHCLGFVKRRDLWRHNKTCNFKSGDNDDKSDENDGYHVKCQKLQAKSKLLILPSICPGKSSAFQEVVASMKSDNITITARNDPIISALGTMMVEKVGTRRSYDISQHMRNLARLLLSLREADHDENAQLSLFLRPEKFDVVVQCVMDVSKFDAKNGEKHVGIPSLALHIGHALKKCVGIARGKALREKDKLLLENVEHFEKLMKTEWKDRISHHSLTTLNDRKHNQQDILPVTSDLQKLKEYITFKIMSLTSHLQATSRPAIHIWRELCELVLNRLILFNKRRGGETAKLRVETYTSRPDWHKSTNQEIVASLSGIEQQLFKRMDMVETNGKRGRKVPILLTKEVREAIDVLVEKRSEVGVNPNNPYIFATGNGSLGHLRPWECMKKLATNEDLQLEKPEAVTSTRLRKYVATVSQILDLHKHELDWLARHLGHDIQVHREYYRLHESTIELAKVGKILEAVDDGKTSKWAGKSLDEIDLNRDISPVADDGESGTEDDSESDSDAELRSPSVNVRNRRRKEMERSNSRKSNEKTSVLKASTSASNGATNTLRKKKSHILWTKEEKEAIFNHLGEFIKRNIVPGKRECESCIKQSGGVLANREWTVVKDCARNIISRAKALQGKKGR